MNFSDPLHDCTDRFKLCRLAHDLINNISVILGRCEFLGEVLGGNTAAERHLCVIVEEARQIAHRITERPCQMAEEQYRPTSHEYSNGAGSRFPRQGYEATETE